jgi:hypothetical protein
MRGRKETDQSGGSKNSRSGSKSKGLDKEKFAKQKAGRMDGVWVLQD